jgi:hypothetical protein
MPRPALKENRVHTFAVQLLTLNGVPGLVWWHTPNEGKRSARTGGHLKRMGMLPGVADLAIVLPGGRACFLELKREKGGSLGPDQRAFRDLCEMNGAPFAMARSPDEVTAVLRKWGAIRNVQMPLFGECAA